MFDTTKYFPRSVDSEHPSQSEHNESLSQDHVVTYDMVHNPEGRSPDHSVIEMTSEADRHIGHDVTSSPQLMIIFEEGDINSALHFIIESVHNPFASNAVAMVLVEEKIRGRSSSESCLSYILLVSLWPNILAIWQHWRNATPPTLT